MYQDEGGEEYKGNQEMQEMYNNATAPIYGE